jgi:hypothetical protein
MSYRYFCMILLYIIIYILVMNHIQTGGYVYIKNKSKSKTTKRGHKGGYNSRSNKSAYKAHATRRRRRGSRRF